MPETPTLSESEVEGAQAAAALARAELTCPFGPSFFLGHLGRFVRDHCPDPKENLPTVQIRLADGTALDLCHIIGISPHWVVFAVRDTAGRHEGMVIEIVPFDLIRRVSIQTRHAEGGAVGFLQTRPPAIIGAETLLHAAMPADRERAPETPSTDSEIR